MNAPTTPFDTLLVANRGEIARRILRSARDLGLRTVAVFARSDAGAAFVAEADVAVDLGDEAGGIPYLDVARLLDAARRTGAQAIHPGYGFVAERADVAMAVADAGLVWVGPSPHVMAAMADKDAAKARARKAGVPVVPGVEGRGLDHAALAALAIAEVGFPCLVKAAAGGGGRGMRRVDNAADLPAALAAAAIEAERNFGDGTLLVERYIARGRHVEVQVLGDGHGNVVHLFERDCSVQRRHQKLIEEAPAPGLDPALCAALHDDAVRLAKDIGYVSAGTFEFLVDVERNTHHFLEVNARVQVEHPVTELVTGVDIVRAQLRVAMGLPLGLGQADVALRGAAIEVRICAEDPAADFAPQAGDVVRFAVEDRAEQGNLDGQLRGGLRVDAALEPSRCFGAGAVPVHYDSMVGKLLAWGEDRDQARRRLRRAVDHTRLWGPRHNLVWLREALGDADFARGGVTTAFIAEAGFSARLAAAGAPTLADLPDEVLVAAALGLRGPALQRRFRSNPHRADVTVLHLADDDGPTPAAVHVALQPLASGGVAFAVDRAPDAALLRPPAPRGEVQIVGRGDDSLRLAVDGVQRTVWLAVSGGEQGADGALVGRRVWLQWPQGVAVQLREGTLLPLPRPASAAPGAVVARTPAIVVAVHVEVGEAVVAGQKLVTLEAMKMLSTLSAAEDGTVASVEVVAGQSVAAGARLVVVTP